MLTVTLRAMLTHRLRLVLTTLSIALGIAFLAGTLILTDTIKHSFDQLYGSVSSGTDAVVRPASGVGGLESASRPVPAALLDEISAVDGVRAATGRVSGYALLTDTHGRAVSAAGSGSTMGLSLPADEQLRGDVRILSGRAPVGPDEVAIDATSSTDAGIPLGSTIDILLAGPTRQFTVVGTVGFGDDPDLGGSTTAYFDVPTAQQILGQPDSFEAIDISAGPGVSQADLAQRLGSVLPTGFEAVTGQVAAQEAADSFSEDIGFFGALLMVFAGIALFTGSFIIWNTFSMTVTQRTREIALTRAIGGTRGQIVRSLLVEAVLLGLVASALGLGLGVLVALGLTALLDLMGFSIPGASLQLQPRTIWLPLAVGTAVTVLAALVPARRSTRVMPVEALQDATPGARPPSRRRAIIGGILVVAGGGLLAMGLYGGGGVSAVGLGVLAVVLGVTIALPLVAAPLANLVGRAFMMRGASGDLARQNAMRNPRRTAATAAALMIGLTVVTTIGVFATSLKASFGDVLGGSTKADLFVARSSLEAPGFSPEVAQVVADVPGVAVVSSTGYGEARFDGEDTSYAAVEGSTVGDVLELSMIAGSSEALTSDGVIVSRAAAERKQWSVGDRVPVELGGGPQSLKIVGVYDRQGFIGGDYVISMDLHRAAGASQALDASALVVVEDGADVGEVKNRIDAALATHPDARIVDEQEYRDIAGGFVDQLLGFVMVMLLLTVLIALLGIVNTLALSVFERTRELGLLRAIGMTRNQVRLMVRREAAVISAMGAVTGSVLGIGLGIALARAAKDQGVSAVSVSLPQIAIGVALATFAGVIASMGPARRAAKVDVLRAVMTD